MESLGWKRDLPIKGKERKEIYHSEKRSKEKESKEIQRSEKQWKGKNVKRLYWGKRTL